MHSSPFFFIDLEHALRGFDLTGYGNFAPFNKQLLEQVICFVDGVALDVGNLPTAKECAQREFQELFIKDPAAITRGIRRVNELPADVRGEIEKIFGDPQIYHSWNKDSVGYHEAVFVESLGCLADESAYSRYKETLCASKNPAYAYWITQRGVHRCKSIAHVDELCRAYDSGRTHGTSLDAVSALNQIYNKYSTFPFAEECKVLVCDGYFQVSEEILFSHEVYSKNKYRFEAAVRLGKEHGAMAVRAYSHVCKVYATNTDIFKACQQVLFEGDIDVVSEVTAAPRVYGEDLNLFHESVAIRKKHGTEGLTSYKTVCERCARTANLFPAYMQLIEQKKYSICNQLSRENYIAACADRRLVFDHLLTFLDQDQAAKADFLVTIRAIYTPDESNLERVVAFMEDTNIYEANACTYYVQLAKVSGREKARAWLDNLPSKGKELISSSVTSAALRKDPGYQWLIRYVFPKGNYSDYEKNATCGDKLEHVGHYKYDKAGYVDEINGIAGYKLRDGVTEDEGLLTEYQARLTNIRTFVSSRGPDNAALQKEFERKVGVLCETEVHEAFKGFSDLSLQEKLAILLLTQVLRKNESDRYQLKTDVLDILVEYKYAFCENLEGYIQRSADGVTRQPNPISQRASLWNELSSIYGENVKHVLRNEIMNQLPDKEQNRIIKAATAAINHDNTDHKATAKVKAAYSNIFTNPRIPEVGYYDETKKRSVPSRLDTLRKKVKDDFSKNMKFSNEAQERAYAEALQRVMTEKEAKMKQESTFFDIVYPTLVAIRDQYRANIPLLMEEVYLYDINRIQAEVCKYEEQLEEEGKEKKIGGPKNKVVTKKAKTRRIRQHFTKTRETANARMGAFLCIAGDTAMWDNKDYFELVMQDEETNECIGLSMLLNIQNKNGKRYLWFGPNPFESFLGKVSSRQCFAIQYQRVVAFAKANNFDGVVIPPEDNQILGACTNRGGDFPEHIKATRLREPSGKLKIVQFDKPHKLGGDYSYSSGALVWEKEAA